jgi:hypothetical protein
METVLPSADDFELCRCVQVRACVGGRVCVCGWVGVGVGGGWVRG